MRALRCLCGAVAVSRGAVDQVAWFHIAPWTTTAWSYDPVQNKRVLTSRFSPRRRTFNPAGAHQPKLAFETSTARQATAALRVDRRVVHLKVVIERRLIGL